MNERRSDQDGSTLAERVGERIGRADLIRGAVDLSKRHDEAKQEAEEKRGRAERRRKFRTALAWKEITQEQFAVANGTVIQHLRLVLKGERESERLLTTVDEFIVEQFRDMAEEFALLGDDAK
jgi:hypothetical protein